MIIIDVVPWTRKNQIGINTEENQKVKQLKYEQNSLGGGEYPNNLKGFGLEGFEL